MAKIFINLLTCLVCIVALPLAFLVGVGHLFHKIFKRKFPFIACIGAIFLIALMINLLAFWAFRW